MKKDLIERSHRYECGLVLDRDLNAANKILRMDLCLIGGWAIYYIVNLNFQKATGRNYIGSRDIDLGFHINKKL